ncbi:MAG: hypothetical protein AAF533_18645 [Acidobacteriota bacterium]
MSSPASTLPRLLVRLDGRAALERLLETEPRLLRVAGATEPAPGTACELLLELRESRRRRVSVPATIRRELPGEPPGLEVELTGRKVTPRLQALLDGCPEPGERPVWLALFDGPDAQVDAIVELAGRRDAPTDFLSRLCDDPSLLGLRHVRRALLFNPSLPDEALDRLLCTYPRGELLVIAGPSAHPRRVRDRAKLILRRAS